MYGIIGAHGAGETPVPIPNTEVKPGIGDYTALWWETSTVPFYIKPSVNTGGFILYMRFYLFVLHTT